MLRLFFVVNKMDTLRISEGLDEDATRVRLRFGSLIEAEFLCSWATMMQGSIRHACAQPNRIHCRSAHRPSSLPHSIYNALCHTLPTYMSNSEHTESDFRLPRQEYVAELVTAQLADE